MTERKKDMSKVFVNTFLTQHSNHIPPNLKFASSTRVDELETDSNQIGATAKCATHTGRCDHRQGILGWVGGVLVLKAKVSDGKVGKRLKPNS